MRKTLLTTIGTAAALAALAPAAHATQVGGDRSTFGINDATTPGPDVISAAPAIVDGASVWRIVAQTPVSLVTGDCVRVSGAANVPGPTEIHCLRGADIGESVVQLGAGDDRFTVAPDFPDRLRLLGGAGNDELTAGAASDPVLDGGDGDNVVNGGDGDDRISFFQASGQLAEPIDGKNTLSGGNGNDHVFGANGADLVDGGPGNDLLAGDRGADRLLGGDGNDFLNGTEDAFASIDDLDGGLGTDRFIGGREDHFLARDAIAERLSCVGDDRAVGAASVAEVDLLDAFAFADPCPVVSRAPIGERPSVRFASGTARVDGGRARVRVRCAAATQCRGTLTLKGAKRAGYAIPARGTRTVAVKLRGRAGKRAAATLTERGIKGARTQVRPLRLKRS